MSAVTTSGWGNQGANESIPGTATQRPWGFTNTENQRNREQEGGMMKVGERSILEEGAHKNTKKAEHRHSQS